MGALVAAALFAAGDASADDEVEDERPVAAVAAGAGLMMASGAAGFTVVALDKHRIGKGYAFTSAQAGMMLAPELSHAIVGEWTRGLWFSIPGAVAFLGTVPIFAVYPDIVKRGPPAMQYAMSATLTLSLFGNAIGVIDAAFAPGRKARATKSSSSIWLAPTLGGAMLMGTL